MSGRTTAEIVTDLRTITGVTSQSVNGWRWVQEAADRLVELGAELEATNKWNGLLLADIVELNQGIEPCDWDQESFCVVEGCHDPAAHQQLDSMIDDTPIYVMMCCQHAKATS